MFWLAIRTTENCICSKLIKHFLFKKNMFGFTHQLHGFMTLSSSTMSVCNKIFIFSLYIACFKWNIFSFYCISFNLPFACWNRNLLHFPCISFNCKNNTPAVCYWMISHKCRVMSKNPFRINKTQSSLCNKKSHLSEEVQPCLWNVRCGTTGKCKM